MFPSFHMHVLGGVFYTELRVCLMCVDEVEFEMDYHSTDFCQVHYLTLEKLFLFLLYADW